MSTDELEARAIQAVKAALEIVRAHAPAEVEVVLSSDRDGNIRIRERVSGVPLSAFVAETVDTA